MTDATNALRNLLDRYAAYFGNGRARGWHWHQCCTAERHALEILDQRLAARVDPLMAKQRDEGHGAAGKALEIMRKAKPHQLAEEQKLAAQLGFTSAEFTYYMREAEKALMRRAVKATPPSDMAGIHRALETMHYQVSEAFNESRAEPRKTKSAHRFDAVEYSRAQLFMIGMLVGNAENQLLFNLSYATSVGVARVRPIARKALLAPTCERPGNAVDGSDPELEEDVA